MLNCSEVLSEATDDKNNKTSASDAVYSINADNAFVIICSALVFFMTPGVGYFYSGMARAKNALSLIFISFLAMAVVFVQWVIFGFSLTFSETGCFFIGDFAYVGLNNIGSKTLSMFSSVSSATFVIYQGMFATITPSLIFGSSAERFRIMPCILFVIIWTTVVYDFVAYWTWGKNGWLRTMGGADGGAYDFAGGTPVHISSGFAGLAMSIVLGKRKHFETSFYDWKPHNLNSVLLGTAMLWFGWFGFNGGSALAASTRASMAALVTTISAAIGGLSWLIIDYHKNNKLSSLGFCSGVIAGLVAITPASGYVAPWASLIIGALAGVTCNLAIKIKHIAGYDDATDVFGVHGIGGILGNILTGVFAQKWVAALDNTDIHGGVLDGHWMQLVYQLISCAVGAMWSFCWTFAIVFVMQKFTYFKLRIQPENEELGVDLSEMGEMAYYDVGAIYRKSTTNFTNEAFSQTHTVANGTLHRKASDMFVE